jgi:hypothetical protein
VLGVVVKVSLTKVDRTEAEQEFTIRFLRRLTMPEPTPQAWADAFSYCSLDPHFTSKPGKRDAVREYVKSVGMLDDNEKDEINLGAQEYADKWVRIKKLNEKVDGFKNLAMDRLPMIGKSACLSGIADSKGLADSIKALQSTLQQLTFTVRRDVTQNAGGTVTISISILEDPQQDAEEAVLFALAHELGHSADLTLNPYNKSDSSYLDVHNALMPNLPTTTTKNQRLEYFADSFATVFLVSGAGIDRKKIPGAAMFLFAAEAGGGDHPKGDLRIAKVRETLESKC